VNERILRELAPEVLAAVARRYGRFELAEDATQEALIAAAQQWSADGVPDNPCGWLIAVATRRLIDAYGPRRRGPCARGPRSRRSRALSRTRSLANRRATCLLAVSGESTSASAISGL